jgi:hypothetical protein
MVRAVDSGGSDLHHRRGEVLRVLMAEAGRIMSRALERVPSGLIAKPCGKKRMGN